MIEWTEIDGDQAKYELSDHYFDARETRLGVSTYGRTDSYLHIPSPSLAASKALAEIIVDTIKEGLIARKKEELEHAKRQLKELEEKFND